MALNIEIVNFAVYKWRQLVMANKARGTRILSNKSLSYANFTGIESSHDYVKYNIDELYVGLVCLIRPRNAGSIRKDFIGRVKYIYILDANNVHIKFEILLCRFPRRGDDDVYNMWTKVYDYENNKYKSEYLDLEKPITSFKYKSIKKEYDNYKDVLIENFIYPRNTYKHGKYVITYKIKSSIPYMGDRVSFYNISRYSDISRTNKERQKIITFLLCLYRLGMFRILNNDLILESCLML